jgi:hypothetical protein
MFCIMTTASNHVATNQSKIGHPHCLVFNPPMFACVDCDQLLTTPCQHQHRVHDLDTQQLLPTVLMPPPTPSPDVPRQTYIPPVPARGVSRSLAGAALGTIGCCAAVGPSCSWCSAVARPAVQHGRQSCHQHERFARRTLLPSCELHICSRCAGGSCGSSVAVACVCRLAGERNSSVSAPARSTDRASQHSMHMQWGTVLSLLSLH